MRVGLGCEAGAPGGAGGEGLPALLGLEPPGAADRSSRGGRDPLAVAVADALLGASGLGSVAERGGAGAAGASRTSLASAEGPALLEEVVRAVEAENYQVVNADVLLTGVPEDARPELEAVAARLAEILHAPPAAVSVKPAPPGLEELREGSGTGVTARAVVLIDQIGDLDALHAMIRTGG